MGIEDYKSQNFISTHEWGIYNHDSCWPNKQMIMVIDKNLAPRMDSKLTFCVKWSDCNQILVKFMVKSTKVQRFFPEIYTWLFAVGVHPVDSWKLISND